MNNDLISRSELAEVVAKKINNPAIKSWLFAIINEIPTADTQGHVANKAPCDLCMYDPPSSFGGKPCSMCPACAKMGGSEE